MNYFKKSNIIAGWVTFAIAMIVYALTIEPTASLWDCAEFIATSYKLEVGHPPGAPLFMMLARLFTIFAPGPQYAGAAVNLMSATASAFTILFLFWSITHLGRKLMEAQGREVTRENTTAILGAGFIGALAYTFTDTFWFSAVEGEVYALSSMFTALVFWAILQWENVAHEPHSNRWLVLIAYLMGLSIGIHILNLLTVPALVFVYYFKKYPTVTPKGVILATLASGAILGAINAIIIPYTVAIGAWVDRIFVNGVGLPVNSGLAFFVLLLFAACSYGIYITHKRGKVLANTIILCATVILLGYGSYASVVIRAMANPPMNSNNPNNPYALLSLLNRDQYGDKPLLFGQSYAAPPTDIKEKTFYYMGDQGKYVEGTSISGYEYPSEFIGFFPRMYSYKESHVEGYKAWGDVTGKKVRYGKETVTVPTFGENLRYFFSYQMNFMYWRYFLWNFVGRQSDIQSTGEITDGNWLSGIDLIDQAHLGPQKDLPSEMAQNKGRNTYYFLPLILGLIGLIYQLRKDHKNFSVVTWLFVMMGIALVVYFNTTPGEPRERDYVYAGSFYAFCMWIGFGVMAIADLLGRALKGKSAIAGIAATAICACVPVILAAQNWDDHDRSHRYVARDIGFDYLESCLPNAIIMNYGDNDTFPLWYNQEVENVRTDVRVMNMSYLGADWYVDQMKIKANESDPVPFNMPRHKYLNTNDYLMVEDLFDRPVEIGQAMAWVKSDNERTQASMRGKKVDYLPARTLKIPVNRENAIKSGIVKTEDAHLMVDTMVIKIEKNNIDKGEMILLDVLANFEWKRPLYFTQVYSLAALGLRDWLQFDGYAYRLVPIYTKYNSIMEVGRIDVDYMYDNLMNKFRYGNISDPRVYADHFVQNNHNAAQTRNAFARLSRELTLRGEKKKAVEVMDAGVEKIPFSQIRHTYLMTMPVIEAYYLAGEFDKGNAILEDYANNLQEYITYFMTFPKDDVKGMIADHRITREEYIAAPVRDLGPRTEDILKRMLRDSSVTHDEFLSIMKLLVGKHALMVDSKLQEKSAYLMELYSLSKHYGQTGQAEKIDAFMNAPVM